METRGLALDALGQAAYDRETDEGAETRLVHQSDRGSPYLSIRYTERLAEAGIKGSVGSRGDAYDHTLAESVIGLFKTEVIRHAGPWRSLDDVEYATREWVAWFNTYRLLEPLGYLPPAAFEQQFEQQAAVPPLLERSMNWASGEPGAIHTSPRRFRELVAWLIERHDHLQMLIGGVWPAFFARRLDQIVARYRVLNAQP